MVRKNKRVAKRKASKRRGLKLQIILMFVAVAILGLVIVGLFAEEIGWFDFSGAERFEVADECGLILGNLVHQIRDDGECRNKCVNECDVRGMEFTGDYVFETKLDDCNFCECWCE